MNGVLLPKVLLLHWEEHGLYPRSDRKHLSPHTTHMDWRGLEQAVAYFRQEVTVS